MRSLPRETLRRPLPCECGQGHERPVREDSSPSPRWGLRHTATSCCHGASDLRQTHAPAAHSSPRNDPETPGTPSLRVEPVILLEVARAVAQRGWGESWGHFQPEEGPHEDHGQHPTGAGSKVGSHARENRGHSHCRRGGPRAPRRAGLSSAGGTSGDGGVGQGHQPALRCEDRFVSVYAVVSQTVGCEGTRPLPCCETGCPRSSGDGSDDTAAPFSLQRVRVSGQGPPGGSRVGRGVPERGVGT